MPLPLSGKQAAIICTALFIGLAGAFTVIFRHPPYLLGAIACILLALSVILDVLANALDEHRVPIKALAWATLVLAFIATLAPLSYVRNDVVNTFDAWLRAGAPKLTAMLKSITVLQFYPTGKLTSTIVILAIAFISGLVAVLAPFSAIANPKIGKNRKANSGPWGASWMHQNDIAYLRKNKNGLPLARYKGGLLRYLKNDARGWRGGHHLVVSGTRGGKGVSAVIPAILDHLGPVVVLDIKGENFAVTRRQRKSLGRTVAVLNPFGIIEAPTSQFNPLDYVRNSYLSRDISVIADGLVKPEEGDGEHFSRMARQLVEAAIEVIITQETNPERKNLISVADLLLSANLDETLTAWVENRDIVGHRPALTAATILRAGDRERGSIQTSVAKAFEWMQSNEMRRFLQGSTVPLNDILDDKIDLFIVVPLDQVDKQAIFMRLFINLVLGTVVRQDGMRKVKAPILMVLDEFVRMGRMEQIMNIANVAAGAGIEAMFVTQDIGQVEKAYSKNDARSIFGSCITKRIFNLNDIDTAEWVARHLGESTIYSRQIREAKSFRETNDLSYSEQRQKLMSAEQILGMSSNEVLLLVGNKNPLRAKENRYYEAREYQGKWDENPLH